MFLTLALLSYQLQGVQVDSVFTLIIVSTVWALFLSVVKPIINLLALPFQILTLGLFTLVINIVFVVTLSKLLDGFVIHDIVSATIIVLVSLIVNLILNIAF